MASTAGEQQAEDRANVFVPARLVERLGSAAETESRFTGVVLVADIAGYGRLTEVHAQGEEGIEKLSGLLGQVFGQALAIVEAHGGELVYFAGDALVCYWDANWPAAAVHDRPAACARRLVEQMRLPVHVSMATGSLWAARVGGWAGRWNLLFGGAATRAAFQGLATVKAGEVRIVAPSSDANAAAGRVPGTVTPPYPTRPDFAPPILGSRALLPVAVERRTDVDGAWTGELRQVDCLFVRLPNLDESRADALVRFRRALYLFHDTLDTASATGRLAIDHRGLTLVWVVGEPAAERGRALVSPVEAAAALLERLEESGLQPSAGMAAGLAFCGTFGSASRREIVAVGTPMVVAARLMDQGLRGLLVAGTLAPHQRAGVRSVPLPPVTLKGFSRPVPVARVERVSRDADDEPGQRLVGRTAELAALSARLDALTAGEGGVCFILGPAGAGKTALVGALEGEVRRRRCGFAIGEAHAAEQSVPYLAWRRIYRTLFPELPFDEPARLPEQLRMRLRQLGRDPDHAPLLSLVFSARIPDTAATLNIVGENRALATRDLLLTLLASRLADRQVIALEDLHEMDSSSLALLASAVRRLPQVLFVVTSREDEAEVAAELRQCAKPLLVLPPLVGEDVARLAAAGLGMILDAAAANRICARANGIPLYVRAYLRNAREASAAAAVSNGPELPPGVAELGAEPDPQRGVLARCFDGLSAIENFTVKVASVLGERFNAALLEETLETVSGVDLARTLNDICRRGILRRDPDGAGHRFDHALLRQACYEAMPARQRRQLHRRVAAALERALGPDPEAAPDDVVVALAHHHTGAANAGRSIHFAEQAALRLFRQGAYREVIRLLDQCLSRASEWRSTPAREGDPRLRWLRLKADAAGAIGDRDTRQREAENAITLANPRAPRLPLARTAIAVARLITFAGRGRRALVPAHHPSASSAADLELAQLHRQLAINAYFSGQSVEIAYNTTSALHHAQRAGRSPVLADSLASMGTCLGLIGFARAGRRHLEAAAALATDLGSDPALVYAHLQNALFLIGRGGEWNAVLDHIELCQQACRRTGNTGDWGNAQALRFWMHHYEGDVAAAHAAADTLAAAAVETAHPQHQSWAARFRALCHLRRLEWEPARDALSEARALLEEATERGRQIRPLYELVPVVADLSGALTMLDRHDEAAPLHAHAFAMLWKARRATGHAVLEGLDSLARTVLRSTDDPGPTDRRRARQLLELLRLYSRLFPIGRPRHALFSGRLAFMRGRTKSALALWQNGLRAAQELGMRHDARLLTQAMEEATATIALLRSRAAVPRSG